MIGANDQSIATGFGCWLLPSPLNASGKVAIDVVVDDVTLLGMSASDRTTVTGTASTGDPDLLLVSERSETVCSCV